MECPNYATRWGCPPFDDNPQPDLSKYDTVEIYQVKVDIVPAEFDGMRDLLKAMQWLIQSVRGRIEPTLLKAEKIRSGRAALFTGICPHCNGESCARGSGDECRHPDVVRPSLEALGFDIVLTSRELFNTEILWADDKKTPAYLCLVGAVFY